jgi:hypothetical protein
VVRPEQPESAGLLMFTVLESRGCKVRTHPFGWQCLNANDSDGLATYLLKNAREADFQEWADNADPEGVAPMAYVRDALVRSMTQPGVFLVEDEAGRTCAFLGTSRGWLWSFWAKPSPTLVKATIEMFPEVIRMLKRESGYKVLRNYILPSNTFFLRLLEREGAKIDKSPGRPGYYYFEV